MDTQRIRELLDKRDAIDLELVEAIAGNAPKRILRVKCGSCGAEGHTARTCAVKIQG